MKERVVRKSALRTSKKDARDLLCGVVGSRSSRKTRPCTMSMARVGESPSNLKVLAIFPSVYRVLLTFGLDPLPRFVYFNLTALGLESYDNIMDRPRVFL